MGFLVADHHCQDLKHVMAVNILRLHIWLIVLLVYLELNLKMHLCITLTETSQGFSVCITIEEHCFHCDLLLRSCWKGCHMRSSVVFIFTVALFAPVLLFIGHENK